MIYFFALFSLVRSQVENINYPHWNITAYGNFLDKFDDMIQEKGFLGNSACFDMDGTITSQKHGYMESMLLEFAINLMEDNKWIHPNYQLDDYKKTKEYFGQAINFIMDEDDEKPSGFSRFWHLEQLFSSMTLEEHEKETDLWISKSGMNISDYFFFPMLDLLQRLTDYDINIFVLSASNTNFISRLFYHVQKELEYLPGLPYDFGDNINFIGNDLLIGDDGRYTSYMDNTYVQNQPNEAYFIDGEGKSITIKRYIEGTLHLQKPVFSMGNSDGDYYMIQYIGNDYPDTLSAVVNPIGSKLEQLIQELGLQVLSMNSVQSKRF